MKKTFFAFFAFFLICSCKEKSEEGIINVDLSSREDIALEILADSVFYVLLDTAALVPSVDEVLVSNDYIFMFSERHREILIYDKAGAFVNKLDRIGRGPQEYIDIGVFAYNEENHYLLIFSRERKEFIRYSVPELKFMDRWDDEFYYNALVALDSENFVLTREESKDTKGGLVISNVNNKQKSDIPINSSYTSQELSVSRTFSVADFGSLYYIQPGHCSRIFRISPEKTEEELYLDFGKFGIPQKYWDASSDSDINFGQILRDGNHYAVMPQFLRNTPDALSFWYICSDRENFFQFYIHNKMTGRSRAVKKVTIPGYDGQIVPLGLSGDYYITSLLDIAFEREQSPNEFMSSQYCNNRLN